FSDYLVAQKTPSIRYFPDARCTNEACGKTFDWEIEPAAFVGNTRLMVASTRDAAGEGRANKRCAYSLPTGLTTCPWCERGITPRAQSHKPKRKKVRLSVFYCPNC